MINQFIAIHALPRYRETQFYKAYYQEPIDSFDGLTTWPKDLRQQLAAETLFSRLEEVKTLISEHKDVYKTVFSRTDKQQIETVLMRHGDGRNTVCVSCMVGCPVKCTFCATGQMGLRALLSADEIVDQVLHFQRLLKRENQSVTNIVFMGMGEPMLNLEQVEQAIDIFTDPGKMAMSDRRVTISTSGYAVQLQQFLSHGFKGRIAISLHAPTQQLREQLMPVAKLVPLPELFVVLDEYTKKTNKRITFEYILIKGVNDQELHAKQLVELLKRRFAHVNLIPNNPVAGSLYERPSNNQVHRFAEILRQNNIPYTLRVTMGDDIQAACGQLISSTD
ncbi:23S rRNA (adenine(2503)-C(2))-methyltransferase RlmN [Candidatus Roizmanbacteria bacterium]|nr:23S rRNA (adenine(2503)-C(2))-methyltransferase RlmN [Candidatus Roizmanbacteria bacterium]